MDATSRSRLRADNLSTLDDNTTDNVFVRDMQANTTTLVSRQSVGDGGAGATPGFSDWASISSDGRYVAFESLADNLSAADNNAARNVFVRDTQTNTTTLISRQSATDGGAGGDDNSTEPAISGDGRHVAFDSLADNLSTEDSNSKSNVFVRDTQTNTTTLASRQSTADGGAAGDDDSHNASNNSLSSDGRYLSMESYATNFSSIDDDSPKDIFVRDLQAARQRSSAVKARPTAVRAAMTSRTTRTSPRTGVSSYSSPTRTISASRTGTR